MRAILLSAGYGKRLLPLTKNKPKCLLKIKGKVLLDLWLDKLINLGIKKILINVHYKKEMIIKHIKKSKYRNFVKIIEETKILGTAKTLIVNYDFYKSSDLMLIHSDNLCIDDLRKFLIAHKKKPKNCLMTMLAFNTLTPETCGILKLNNKGIVTKMYEKKKNSPGNLANGAVYILSKKLTKNLQKHNYFDFSLDVIPTLMGKIFVYKTNAPFIDIGTPKNFKKSQILL